MQVPVTLSALYCYPVKGMGAVELEHTRLGLEGLAWDRRWMLIDERNRFVTQRQLPAMAAVRVALERYQLVLRAPSGRRLHVPLVSPNGEPLATHVHGELCYGIDEGDEAADFFTQVFADHWKGRVRLLRFAYDSHAEAHLKRTVAPVPAVDSCPDGVAQYSDKQASTGFADGYPLLVTSVASLQALNQALSERGLSAIEMARFRPNVVLDGLAPFAEHSMQTLSLPSAGIRLWLCKPCERCPVTRVDQTNGHVTHRHEPLPALQAIGPFPGTAIFGVNAIVLEGDGQQLTRGDRGICI